MAAPASDLLSFFRLHLWNRWTEFNKTGRKARSQRPLPSLCFSGRSEKQDGRPSLCWAETFSTFPLKPLNGIQRNLTGSKISTSSTNFVFLGLIWKTRWPPGLCLAETVSTSLKPLNGIQRNRKEARSQQPLPSGFLIGLIGKTRWPPRLLIGWSIFDFASETTERNSSTKLDRKRDLIVLFKVWMFSGRPEKQDGGPSLISWDIFDFSSETAERNSTKLDKKQDLNSLYQVDFYRTDRKNKVVSPASDWLRHFDFSSETTERNSSTKLDR